jgi:hypothetical protein
MKTYLFQILLFGVSLICLSSCGNNTITYTNACCCNTVFPVGTGAVFVPNIFTPNFDATNDAFDIAYSPNIKAIYDVNIKKQNGNLIIHLDTMHSTNMHLKWMNNSGTPHEGNFTVDFKVSDTNNNISNLTANSCSYNCKSNTVNLPNKSQCKTASQWNPVTGVASFPNADPCLQ